jgi:outer membrane protein assembly factor BamB
MEIVMKFKVSLWLIIFALIQVGCETTSQPFLPTFTPTFAVDSDEISWTEISFYDLVPSDLDVDMYQCWNGMGMDDQGRIYIGYTSFRDNRRREDFIVFRYDPATGEREFLGSFMDIAAAEGNLADDESMPKGHTRLIFADGKMFMGSQGFHDFKWEIDELPNYRGSHILAYDVATDTWQDLAADLPGGVITENQGIVALNILRDENLLVGLAHPYSDIVLYDYQDEQIDLVVPGIPWSLGNPLSREVIVAPSGNIYTYRGTEDPKQRDEVHPVWVYNIHNGEMRETEFTITNGFWIGQTETRDGSKIYVSTTNGQLYEFDVATESFKDLGHMLPEEEYEAGRRILYQYGPILSPDEKKIYFVPSVIDNPEGSGELYEYDIASGEVTFIEQLPIGIYTSGDLRDDENIYFAHFGSERQLWGGDVRLMVISVPEE